MTFAAASAAEMEGAPDEPPAAVSPPNQSPTDRPRRAPEELADLVTCLPRQEQAELTYDLVLYAARAVDEGDLGALAAFLAELEDIAVVNADPDRRLTLEEEVVEELAAEAAPLLERRSAE